MGFVDRRETRPLFDEFVADRLFTVETVLFLLRNSRIMKGNAALFGDTFTNLLDIELGNVVVVCRDWHHELKAKRQRLGQDHIHAPLFRWRNYSISRFWNQNRRMPHCEKELTGGHFAR